MVELKFLGFSNLKNYFIYFNTSLYNSPNINGSIFFITSFKYSFFILSFFLYFYSFFLSLLNLSMWPIFFYFLVRAISWSHLSELRKK